MDSRAAAGLGLCESDAPFRVPRNTPLFEPAFRALGLVRSGDLAPSASGVLRKVL
jgi:hypothetical protein